MVSLINRVAALEGAVAQVPPAVIDDVDVIESLTHLRAGTAGVSPHHIVALYRTIEPSLRAAVLMGAGAYRFCRSRGIERPQPLGAVDLTANIASFNWVFGPEDLPEPPHWLTVERIEVADRIDRLASGCRSIDAVREALLLLLLRRHGVTELRNASLNLADSDVPALTETESSRQIRLIEPLQVTPDPDLPLLVWRDEQGAIRTSWPDQQTWAPVDVGMPRLGYLLLAHSEQARAPEQDEMSEDAPAESDRLSQDNQDGTEHSTVGAMFRDQALKLGQLANPTNAGLGLDESPAGGMGRSLTQANDRPVLTKRILEASPPSFADEDLISKISNGAPPFVRAWPDLIDSLYLAIEPALRASVLMGAQSRRRSRASGIDQAQPLCAIDMAATLVSYDSTPDMPEELAATCGWASPDSEHYDYPGRRLHMAYFTIGTVRGALIFRLLEREGVGHLRQRHFSEADVPMLNGNESKRLLKLIAPLQFDPDPDLPLLVWRDETGAYRTSWSEESGQTWTKLDTVGSRPEYLLLAHPEATAAPPKGEWVNHYVPGSD